MSYYLCLENGVLLIDYYIDQVVEIYVFQAKSTPTLIFVQLTKQEWLLHFKYCKKNQEKSNILCHMKII